MEKAKRIKSILLIAFVAIQLMLTIFIYIADKNNIISTTIFKYSGIILCFIVSCFSFKTERWYFLTIGLGFTLIADYFLLVINKYYVAGISAFIIVQAMYFLYIKPNYWKISLIIRGSLILIVFLIVGIALKINDATVYLAAFYFINLIMNTVDSYIDGKKLLLLFSIGLTLFLGCDISVGFFNLSTYISYSSPIVEAIVNFSTLGMWLFYLPSQTLIALTPYVRDKIKSSAEKPNLS